MQDPLPVREVPGSIRAVSDGHFQLFAALLVEALGIVRGSIVSTERQRWLDRRWIRGEGSPYVTFDQVCAAVGVDSDEVRGQLLAEGVLKEKPGDIPPVRTHCGKGHSYADGNAIDLVNGHRRCRRCVEEAWERRRQRKHSRRS